MKIKDKKAFSVFILFTLVLWQFLLSIEKLLLSNQSFQFSNPYFEFLPVKNTGGAYGMFSDFPSLLAIFGVIILAALSFYVYKNVQFEDKFKILASGVFACGILGNTFQRFKTGCVLDYIKINIFDFPVFNFFDILISVSIFLFILYTIKDEILKKKDKKLGN